MLVMRGNALENMNRGKSGEKCRSFPAGNTITEASEEVRRVKNLMTRARPDDIVLPLV